MSPTVGRQALVPGHPSGGGAGNLRLIDRGELLAALDRAAARKVTIISAPAGSGKTSLLRAWADRSGRARRLAVVPVRRDQQDAQQFWLALLSAVRQATGTADQTDTPAPTPDFNGRAMVDRVLSELADAGGEITVVIDDLHELNRPEALAQLTSLLTNLPPRAHAVLATRRDLRLGLHRLRLDGELAEIRAADLRFSEHETRELLDSNHIDKYNGNGLTRLLTANGVTSNNGTKSTPTLTADLYGDWREEVVWRETNSAALRLYTTTAVTTRRIYTLMHDAQYRSAVSWQNGAYNQPPHTGFNIGAGMDPPPVPNITVR